MQKCIAVLLLSVLFMQGALAADVPVISQDAALVRMQENVFINVIDVREEELFNAAHIPGAVSFPLDQLEAQMKTILKNGFSAMSAEIIVYGETEEDAFSGAEILLSLGFTNVSVLGAVKDWTGELIDINEEIARSMRLFSGFAATDLNGNPVSDSVLSGYRLTMVNVWATYCNPCLNELHELAKLNAAVQEKGVQVIGLLSDVTDNSLRPVESQVDLAQEIVELTGADYLHLIPDPVLYKKILSQVTAVPTTLFVDEKGSIVGYAYMGSRDCDRWMKVIEETLLLLPAEDEGT